MTRRARRPFWIHQFAEYLMGIALVSMIFQDPEPAVPVAVGIVLLLNAATVRGPLGAFAGVRRRTHRTVDVAMMVLLVAAAAQPWVPMSTTGRLVCLVMLVPFASSWYYTDWDELSARRRRRTEAGSDRSASIGRSAGRIAGSGWNTVRRATREADSMGGADSASGNTSGKPANNSKP